MSNQKEYKIFDAHCDTINVIFDDDETLLKNTKMVNKNMLEMYKGYIQVFATWVSPKKEHTCLQQALERSEKFFEVTDEAGFTVIKDKKTLSDVVEGNKTGAILAIEDGAALAGSLKVLRALYRIGYRAVTLTWNGENELGEGAAESNGGGLTDFGKSVVREMNSLGMVVDVSHLSERGFWDVMEQTSKPVMASHSNSKTICSHARNLSDEQIKALIKNRGVMGINLFPKFLNDSGKADVTDILRNIEYVLALGGENVLGIGTDFDGISYVPFGVENASMLYKIFDETKKIGYSDDLIEKITHKNFVRVFSECLA